MYVSLCVREYVSVRIVRVVHVCMCICVSMQVCVVAWSNCARGH